MPTLPNHLNISLAYDIMDANNFTYGAIPFQSDTGLSYSGNVTDVSGTDSGTLFDIALGSLAPGQTVLFNFYYGATDSEAQAHELLDSVEALAYGLIQPTGGNHDPALGTDYTFLFGVGEAGVVSKRYFGNGILLANRLNDELYYNLYDPTGLSTTWADANGNHVGRILYDSMGGVLTSTMPLTLTTHLSHLPDASTGLIHMANGRWLDTFTGHAQQVNIPGFHTASPSPLGALKTQSKPYNGLAGWEPYAFGFVKNSVAEVIKYSVFNTMIEYTQRINITIVSDVPFSLGNYRVRNAASSGLIVDGGTTAKIEFSVSAWSKRFGQDIPPLSEKLARQLASQVQEIDLVAGGIIVSAGGRYGVNGALVGSPRITGYKYGLWDDIEGLRFGRTAVFGFGLDFAAGAYFQYQVDKSNPFLTNQDRIYRSVGVGLFEASGALILSSIICGSTAGIGCLVLAGVGGGVIGNQFVANGVFQSIFTDDPNLSPRPIQ